MHAAPPVGIRALLTAARLTAGRLTAARRPAAARQMAGMRTAARRPAAALLSAARVSVAARLTAGRLTAARRPAAALLTATRVSVAARFAAARLSLAALLAAAGVSAATLLAACDISSPRVDALMPEDTILLSPTAPDSVRDQVMAELQQYYADLTARDWERFRDHFWPGATLTTVWQTPVDSVPRVTITTVEEFIELAPQGPGSREIFEERMTDGEVRGDDRLALVWAKYDARFGDPDDVREWSGVDAFTLLRHEGRWRIVSVAYASDH